jgi:PilZ domain-containing protein
VRVPHRPIDNEPSELKLEHFCKLRENKRLPVAIPLKVNFLSSGLTAHVCTLDVSSTGARLHSAGHRFHPGDVILLQRLISRAHARVVWVGDTSGAKGQVGIECPELEKFFWREQRTRAGRSFTPTFRLL